jgi:hypothetical protein
MENFYEYIMGYSDFDVAYNDNGIPSRLHSDKNSSAVRATLTELSQIAAIGNNVLLSEPVSGYRR